MPRGVYHRKPMTPEVRATLRFLQDFSKKHGYAPTIREIAAGLYISRTTVQRHLDRLDDSGLIARKPGAARAIRLFTRDD